MESELRFCPHCGAGVTPDAIFCSHCGKPLEEPKLSTSIGKQILIYFVSLFLPPFGLAWTFKYLRQQNKTARTVGLVSLILTIVGIIGTVWITMGLLNNLSSSLNSSLGGSINDSQLNQFLQNY
ncbi:zinc-ribbon domain-containing protein [Patescibacteria group bacterium]|jgi:uncharacterized OB-fold protein|nr:zinc-ribbon domain-containing protein [Patescibacteria group bacterium]MCL5114516.1 zinc-ribbon domain-containing protein [Patescibacteria group bacterium]